MFRLGAEAPRMYAIIPYNINGRNLPVHVP